MKCETRKIWTTNDGQMFTDQADAKRHEYSQRILANARKQGTFQGTNSLFDSGFREAVRFILSDASGVTVAMVGPSGG